MTQNTETLENMVENIEVVSPVSHIQELTTIIGEMNALKQQKATIEAKLEQLAQQLNTLYKGALDGYLPASRSVLTDEQSKAVNEALKQYAESGIEKFKEVQTKLQEELPFTADWIKAHKGAAQQRWFEAKKKRKAA